MTSLLDGIHSPADVKALNASQLTGLCAEIRELLVQKVSENGGHLASNLGVVELTIALHRIYNSPEDKIVWDVGHQCYPHKLLTGRGPLFDTLRQYQGISGFPVRTESPHDAFGAGHAGTSVSAALGMALARDLEGSRNDIVAVIGDGSLGAGMAFEAVNHIGQLGTRMTIILNDNGMSISPSVGGLARLLNQVRFHPKYGIAKNHARKTVTRLPWGDSAWNLTGHLKSRAESVLLPNAFWEQLGFTYLGPVDGHNIAEIESALRRARDFESGPTLIHVITTKGKGHAPAETDASKYHGLSPHHTDTATAPSYNQVFGQTVAELMRNSDRIVAITAAMLDGVGLAKVAEEFPDRVFDAGICEQHAVTMAAGLASRGYIPIVAIYSTFLQRAYDQIIHDVCLQNLPVIFAVDRAGIVGEDGKTHQGAFDISYLRSVPNMVLAAPSNENEFRQLLYTATLADQPVSIRYPRGSGEGVPLEPLTGQSIGKGSVLREGSDCALLAIGPSVYPALEAAKILAEEGIDCAVADARYAKPLDTELMLDMAERKYLITIEENTLAGGFGGAVLEFLSDSRLENIRLERIGLPDKFIEHGRQEIFRSMFKLNAEGIARQIRAAFPELIARAKI